MTDEQIELFVSYSHRDETLRQQLDKHLAPLKRQGVISVWHDRQIEAGQEWAKAIDENLSKADIILLFISPDFVASDYCYEKEMNQALERHEKGEAIVIPIIAEPCDWAWLPFGKLQALPREGKAIATWTSQNEAFSDVSRGIRRVVEQLAQHRSRPVVLESPQLLIQVPTAPTFEFDVLTVNERGQEIKRDRKQAEYFRENLGDGVELEMISIPGGTFWMGTDDAEIERLNKKYDVDYFHWERPQHQVTVSAFLMGKFPVTQQQWQQVAALPKVNIDLNPNPSNFKGDTLPVESITWNEAVEFCERLSKKTGKTYRLPSEAEWEYACRAGTTTPFHFGATITGELANYTATNVFDHEAQGNYRKITTSVGSFSANAFGLYDMHGNVLEWCADTWHDNYEGAPTDGTPWITKNDQDSSDRVIRGGSWVDDPRCCRSADRIMDISGSDIGFRVVYAPQDS